MIGWLLSSLKQSFYELLSRPSSEKFFCEIFNRMQNAHIELKNSTASFFTGNMQAVKPATPVQRHSAHIVSTCGVCIAKIGKI